MNGKGNTRDGNRDNKIVGRDNRDKPDRKRPAAGAGAGAAAKGGRAPEQTYEEVRYLKQLIENRTRIRVRLVNNEEISGTVEYYDQSFIRLTREPDPNLFIYKHEIKYFYEE